MSVDWGVVYRTTFTDLVRFLYRKVWDAERAQDLAQEAFVRALRSGGQPDSPRAWIFSIASNLARDDARAAIRRRHHLTLVRVEADVRAESPEDPMSTLDAGDRREQLRRALDALGERDREVLLLWNAGLDYSEIASQTGLSVGSVGTTLARARRRLVDAHATLEAAYAARG
jgi:RNA polymerase sigma-70 factor (ECF subfamily)